MSILEGYAVLTKAMIGVGILSLGKAMADSGWYSGVAISVISPLVMAFALYLLTALASDFKKKIPDELSYYKVASTLSVPAAIILDIAIAVSSFGCAVAYSVVSGAMLHEILGTWSPSVVVIKIVVVCLLSPFCFARTLKRTKIVNFIGLACIAYIVIYAVVMSDPFGAKMSGNADDLYYPRSWRAVVGSIPKFIFAYGCTQNLFGVANEMTTFSATRMNLMSFLAIITASIFNTVCSVFPFITFGRATSSNFLKNFATDTTFWTHAVHGAAAFQVSIGYVLIFHPLRSSLIGCIKRYQLLSEISEERLRFLVSVIVLVTTLLTSLLIGNDLGVVINLTGLLGNTTMSFVIPSYLYCLSRTLSFTWFFSAVLLVCATLLFPLVIYDLLG